MRISYKDILATNEVFRHLNNLRRWTSFSAQSKYNELSKQSLNCITAFILASFAENEGKVVRWERFPKIALYRAYQRAYVLYDTPEHTIDEICKLGDIPRDVFDETTRQIITEKTEQVFADFLASGSGTFEESIYKAATKVATLVELMEISSAISPQSYLRKSQEISKALQPYYATVPGLEYVADSNGQIFQVLQVISHLRNRTRWAAHSYIIECSVLGHLFDTGVFAYIMALEQKNHDEEYAAKMFWMGIFHDVAEVWTSDIPSPIKDRITGFRRATELYEQEKLDLEFYSKLPPFAVSKLQKLLTEIDKNEQTHRLIKGADYLSADSECWRQYVAGSRDPYFRGAINRRTVKIDNREVILTPECKKLFEYFLGYARGLNL